MSFEIVRVGGEFVSQPIGTFNSHGEAMRYALRLYPGRWVEVHRV